MQYLKYTPYAYLLLGLFCIYKGITQLSDPNETPILSFGFAVLAIFMFFFRKRYAQKMVDRRRNTNQK